MIPNRLQPFFQINSLEQKGTDTIIEGDLTCCNIQDFEIQIVGKVKYGLVHRMYLLPENDHLELTAICKKCGKAISVFNSACDGYDHFDNNKSDQLMSKTLCCRQCGSERFSIQVKYEYPDEQELSEMETLNYDNAFTWIWTDLHCKKCGSRYTRFIDFETA